MPVSHIDEQNEQVEHEALPLPGGERRDSLSEVGEAGDHHGRSTWTGCQKRQEADVERSCEESQWSREDVRLLEIVTEIAILRHVLAGADVLIHLQRQCHCEAHEACRANGKDPLMRLEG